MDALEAIATRRSVPKVLERRPERAEIEALLEAAVRAPTHHLTQPWRFVVLAGDALDELGEAWARGAARLGKDPDPVRAKPRRAPVIVAVIAQPHLHNRKVVEIEEHYAVGAAIENLLLAAHASGLGAMIRTGDAAHLDEVRDYLGVGEDESIAGLVYIGYPDPAHERPVTRRDPAAERTEWRGW